MFEGIKIKLNKLNVMFDSLDMDDKKHEEIMSQKESDEVEKMVEPLLTEYKLELHQKFYKLDTIELKLDFIFGSISEYDYGAEKIKVTI